MPYISEKIKLPKELDRRIKLTDSDRSDIRRRYFFAGLMILNSKLHKAVSQRSLAREYGVSRRTIVWILYPDRLNHNKELRKQRGGWRQYYDRQKNTIAIGKTRRYKQSLYLEGKICR